jgi:integrase/recombinase XerC/integrase/recombinase XerD
MLEEELVESSPLERIAPPVSRADQIQPFTSEQVDALLRAAERSQHPRRNKAILILLLDTGLRVSEVCGLRIKDIDLTSRTCRVLGKGNKHRAVFFGAVTAKWLSTYLRKETRGDDEPLFCADSGTKAGAALTRSGVRLLVRRLGKAAGISVTRCSPHTFRHTFAVEFLRAGGNVFSLKQMLGHTSISQSQLYVAVAQADIQHQHRQFSPADRLRSRTA